MYAHLTLVAQGRFPWRTDDPAIEEAVRTLARIAGPRLFLFGLADNHGHVVVEAADAMELGHLRTDLLRAHPFAGVVDRDIHVTLVGDRDHLATLAAYMPRQVVHHKLPRDPALFLGSHLPDVVGARLLPGLCRGVFAALPDVDVAETALRGIGLRGPVVPATDAQIRAVGAVATWTACREALACSDDGRRTVRAMLARRSFVELANGAGIHPTDARDVAEIARASWYRLVEAPVDAAISEVVRMRLGLVALAEATPVFARTIPEKTPPPVLKAPRRKKR